MFSNVCTSLNGHQSIIMSAKPLVNGSKVLVMSAKPLVDGGKVVLRVLVVALHVHCDVCQLCLNRKKESF